MPVLLDYDQLQKLERRRRAKKIRSLRSPKKMEALFRRRMTQLWKRVLLPAHEQIKSMIREGRSPAEITQLIENVIQRAEMQYDIAAEDFVTEWRIGTDRETRQHILRGLTESLGVDVEALYDDPEIENILTMAGSEASQLIRTIPGDYLEEVTRAVRMNYTGEELPGGRSLLQQIQKIGKVSKGRAKVIARDQTKKLSSNLDQQRQRSIGVEEYIWKTSRDQRVVGKPGGLYPKGNKAHANHHIMEGKRCRWDDPTVYSDDNGKTWKKRTSDMPNNHPGQDILCRCTAAPVIDIDKIIQYAKAA